MVIYEELKEIAEINQKRTELSNVLFEKMDLDYLGGHYVRLEDFAIEMNEKFNLGIDINRVAYCQEVYDNGEEKYKMCNVEKVIQELRENGFKDAAVFIENKLY